MIRYTLFCIVTYCALKDFLGRQSLLIAKPKGFRLDFQQTLFKPVEIQLQMDQLLPSCGRSSSNIHKYLTLVKEK